ncbi:MAG: hypothetical protein AAF366_19340 [Pseudomonadota bacterium]
MTPAAAMPGSYADCSATCVPGRVDLARLVFVFYATPLFRAERLVLRAATWAAGNAADLAKLASGSGTAFVVWRVSRRAARQIWLIDRWGATMSWLAAAPSQRRTRLLFGSLVADRPADVAWP